jgi:hypothetical protein
MLQSKSRVKIKHLQNIKKLYFQFQIKGFMSYSGRMNSSFSYAFALILHRACFERILRITAVYRAI